jgi:hypothetical protein
VSTVTDSQTDAPPRPLVQGRGGSRQVPRHDVAVVTSGALADGSALVLTADR